MNVEGNRSGEMDPLAWAENSATYAAEEFVDAYYLALQSHRNTISSFYCPRDGSAVPPSDPNIVWNGTVYEDGMALQRFFDTEMVYTNFEVESMDTCLLNPRYLPADQLHHGSGNDNKEWHRRMSFMLTVVGSIRLKEPQKGPSRTFNDMLVLVPNTGRGDAPASRMPNPPRMRFLILTQNFRFTEWDDVELGKGGDAMRNEFAGTKRNLFRGLQQAGLLKKRA